MISIVILALVITGAALLVGQLVRVVCDPEGPLMLAPAIGLAVLMTVGIAAIELPGRGVTAGIACGALVAAGAVATAKNPAARAGISAVFAAAPVLALSMIPFLAAGRGGTLGVSLNNDMASHVRWADTLRDSALDAVNPTDPDYPLGAHAIVATITEYTGVRTDLVFAGLTVATVLVLALTAQAALAGRVGLVGRVFVGTLVGMPFIIAGYYGQGSFKEVINAELFLALVIWLQHLRRTTGRLGWVPAALILAGMFSNYSFTAAAWPGLLVLLAAPVLVVTWMRRGDGMQTARATARDHAVPLAIATGVLVIVLVPQASRLTGFLSLASETNLTGIDDSSLGNLLRPLPGWTMFGAWDSPDYRLEGTNGFARGMWTALVVALTLGGAAWWVRRGQWIVPVAAVAAVLLWVYADDSQSPYVAAKALVVAGPLLMLLWTRAVAEREAGWSKEASVLTVVAGLLAGGKLLDASVDTLRYSKVGSYDRTAELRSLQSSIDGPVIWLGNSDFIQWQLNRQPTKALFLGFPKETPRPGKVLEQGQPIDVDTVPPKLWRDYPYLVTPRDAAGSAIPESFRLLRTTENFALYRTAPFPRRIVLSSERGGAAAKLDCSSPDGRRLVRRGGTARLRPQERSVPVPTIPVASNGTVALDLPAGRWRLTTPYVSERPIGVSYGPEGEQGARLDPYLGRPGPRWPIGEVRLGRAARVFVRFAVPKKRLTLDIIVATFTFVTATRVEPPRDVPLREACGRPVDYINPGR